MPIDAETEIIHPKLLPIRFDDGKNERTIAGERDTKPMWVCRPDGWDSDFEIYILGRVDSPRDLELAIEASSHRCQIEREGLSLGEGDIELSWVDLTSEPPSVAFHDNEHIYVLWTGTLTDDWKIENFTQTLT